MSDNYRLYASKVAETRTRKTTDRPLQKQLADIYATVRWCEKVWAIEDRIDREFRLA
jgi:hypothetical protein